MLNSPAVFCQFEVVGAYCGYAAVAGAHLYLTSNQVCLAHYPGFLLVEDMGTLLRDSADLLVVEIMLVCKAAQEPPAGTGNFH